MSTVLLIGANGQLGQYLQEALPKHYTLVCWSRQELDLTDSSAIVDEVVRLGPDLLINASAYTAVDAAQENVDLAYQVNADAPQAMAVACQSLSIPLLHFSTDYVFAGDALKPYIESDAPDPQGVYGASKLAGEEAIRQTGAEAYIFRTAWVYSQRANNFYKTMLRLATDRSELSVVSDQRGSPTYAYDLAHATVEVVARLLTPNKAKPATGVYHMTNTGETTWSDFARAIFTQHKLTVKVNDIASSEFPTPVKRPAYSVLDSHKLKAQFGVELPDWHDALTRCVSEASCELV